MGSIVGKTMDDSMKKNQAFMLETQKTMLERQIQMQNIMRERMMAMQVARARDLFHYFGTFYGFALLGMIAGFRRTKSPAALSPILPLTFILAYQADMAYGSKMQRMKTEAEHILLEESFLVDMPIGVPTMEQIEARRQK